MIEKLREDRGLSERLRRAEHLAGIGQVARSVAHEIKNPLNFISLSIDHMLDTYRPDDSEKGERFEYLVRNMKGEIQRISRFAESFLEYGRPIELRLSRTDLVAMLDSILELVQPRAMQEEIIIIREYAGLPDLAVDPELLRTCFFNLVLNAFDAMPHGGELRIHGTLRQGEIALAVSDTGSGIDPLHLEKIFEPYFTTKPKGVGLGLALTRKIIEEHGGRIHCETRAEVGCRFIVTLPLSLHEKSV
jgi:signal transduction histidine kinase